VPLPRPSRPDRPGRSESADPRPPVRPARLHGLRFAMLALTALIAVRLPLPWVAVAVLLVIAADIEGVRTAIALSRERMRGTMLACAICGIALVSLLGISVIATLALYPITYQRQQCIQGANTDIAKAACDSQFSHRINRLQGGILGG
jgi:hypothetical protein